MKYLVLVPLFLFFYPSAFSQCDLPSDSGDGVVVVPLVRYYYDASAGDCLTFDYTGLGGNANNYETYNECISACGLTCQLEPEIGPCAAAIPRWYFDTDLGYCTTFTWGGCGGNANNYVSFEACKTACNYVCDLPPDRGPCLALFERYYYNPEIGDCQTFFYGGCGGNANNYESYNDCITGCGTVCQLEPDPGPCRAIIPRYYFNPETGTCEEFIYGGCGGNANNYETFNSCIEACGSVCQFEPDPGPCLAAFERWYFDTGSGHCESFIYGGCGGNANNYLTKSACMEACGEVCYLEPDPGPCYALLPRWFYNPNTKDCESFIYGGCGGNGNNYITYNDCMGSCADVCDQPMEVGPCAAAIPRYYYNKETNKCERFIYGGCGANDNNFVTREECENACPCIADRLDDRMYAFTMVDTLSSSATLSSSSVLIDTSSVFYSSGEYVELLPGFRIDRNAILKIEMRGCLEE